MGDTWIGEGRGREAVMGTRRRRGGGEGETVAQVVNECGSGVAGPDTC